MGTILRAEEEILLDPVASHVTAGTYLRRLKREAFLRADGLSNHPEQLGSQIARTAVHDIVGELIRSGTDHRVCISPASQYFCNEPEIPTHAPDALTTTRRAAP
jgi:hypothetical protein